MHLKRIYTKSVYLILFLCTIHSVQAQSGGERSFQFLEFSPTARLTALGGEQVGLIDKDVSLSFSNPAQISRNLQKGLSVNYANYLSDISYGYASYAQQCEKLGVISGGIHFVSYGSFVETDQEGNVLGAFSAAEYVGLLSYSRFISSKWSLGVSLKPIYSKLEKYTSFALACDIGTTYLSSSELTSFGFVLKNIGGQISTYYDGAPKEKLPFDIQLGISHRLKHAPFRFFATLHDLNNWDIYSSISDESSSVSKEFFQHMNLGLEFLPGDKITARVGYNHQRRTELKLEDAPGLTGLSFGFGVKIRRIVLDYGIASYYAGSSSHQFSIYTTL